MGIQYDKMKIKHNTNKDKDCDKIWKYKNKIRLYREEMKIKYELR